MSVIIVILEQNKGSCEVITQLEREKGKRTREVELMRCAEGGDKKETRVQSWQWLCSNILVQPSLFIS